MITSGKDPYRLPLIWAFHHLHLHCHFFVYRVFYQDVLHLQISFCFKLREEGHNTSLSVGMCCKTCLIRTLWTTLLGSENYKIRTEYLHLLQQVHLYSSYINFWNPPSLPKYQLLTFNCKHLLFPTCLLWSKCLPLCFFRWTF